MTTPAVSLDITVESLTTQQYFLDGVLQSTTSWLEPMKRFIDFRPESVSSPKGVFGYRYPTHWYHYGGSGNGVKGMYIQTIDGPRITKYVTTGVVGAVASTPGVILPPDPQGRVTAIRKALGKYGEAHTQFGAALQEVASTSRMVGKYYDHANQLADRTFEAVQKNRRVRQQFRDFLRNGWRGAPGLYLEYLFGMKPLADDIANAVDVLFDRSQAVNSAMLMRLRGKHEYESVREEHFWRNIVSDAPIYGTVTTKQTNRASMLFRLPSWYWETLPPVTLFSEAWEGTTLSFVADWVLPVHQWIAGFEGFQLRPFFEWGIVSEKLEQSVESPRSPDKNFVRLDATSFTSSSFERRVLSTWPGEELFSLPRFRSTLGIDKLDVGAALLAQKLARLQRLI